MPPPVVKECHTCTAYAANKNECRLNPPATVASLPGSIARWPTCQPDDWCMKWTDK